MNEFSNSLPMMLYRALDVVMPEFRRIFLEHGLTEQQWRVLRVLWEDDEQPLLVLSAKTLISSPSLVGVVDRLERDELVKRKKNEQDRRSVWITLTAQGAQLEDEVSAKAEAAYQALEKRVGRKEWQQLMTSLEKLAVNG